MITTDIAATLRTLLSELADGAPQGGAYVLNSGDVGLLRSLDKLDAAHASAASAGGATIAAHAEHVRYGISLMNRWATHGGDPFAAADWGAAWTVTDVTDARWAEIRAGLRDEVGRWQAALATPREATTVDVNGMVGSIAHLSYHLGAIRQIAKAARGPRDG